MNSDIQGFLFSHFFKLSLLISDPPNPHLPGISSDFPFAALCSDSKGTSLVALPHLRRLKPVAGRDSRAWGRYHLLRRWLTLIRNLHHPLHNLHASVIAKRKTLISSSLFPWYGSLVMVTVHSIWPTNYSFLESHILKSKTCLTNLHYDSPWVNFLDLTYKKNLSTISSSSILTDSSKKVSYYCWKAQSAQWRSCCSYWTRALSLNWQYCYAENWLDSYSYSTSSALISSWSSSSYSGNGVNQTSS